jgi:hypothetical protein
VLAIILEDIESGFNPVFGRVTNELVSFAGLDIWNQNELLAESLNTYLIHSLIHNLIHTVILKTVEIRIC